MRDLRPTSRTPAARIKNGIDTRQRVISVVIVDDDDDFRAALSEVLESYGLDVVGKVPDGKQALRFVKALTPDVVLMDLAMPGLSGVETTRRLVAAVPDTAVLILAMSSDETEVIDAMIAGACGYVVKGTPPASLVADIRAAAEGECVMSASVAAKAFGSFVERRNAQAAPDASSLLSKRELEVLTLIANGKQNTDIAKALVISPYTVRNHISSVLRKLQLENRTQAAGYAARHRLV
jgi:DNA-binding NarL/FixJ family response regulator